MSASNLKFFGLYTLLFLALTQQSNLREKRSKVNDWKKLLAEYAEFEVEVKESLAKTFAKLDQDTCQVGDQDCDAVLMELPENFELALKSLIARVDNLEKILRALIPLVTEVVIQASHAFIPVPVPPVSPKLGAVLSCESHGKPISVCIWEKRLNGPIRKIYIADDDVIQDGKHTTVDGISYEGGGLAGGKSGLKIQAVHLTDIGLWSCLLVSKAGQVFTGNVVVAGTECDAMGLKCYDHSCIHRSVICDGLPDCPDGVDEVPAVCSPDQAARSAMEKGPFTTDDEDILSEAFGDEVEGSGELPGTADSDDYSYLG